ncbi:MAG TPA: hypothetical protein VFG99_10440, partial [Chloroflexia bacterium]|nr:hypothetical protein [Chloroflexia bacterium]
KGKQQSIYVGYDGTRYESRSYRGCANRYSSVHISYTNKRVDSKYAYWGLQDAAPVPKSGAGASLAGPSFAVHRPASVLASIVGRAELVRKM